MKKKSQMQKNKKRVLIIDDHPIMRQGLAQLINHQSDFMVCGEAEDAHEALKAIPVTNPDVAIVDISLKQRNGIELIKDIRIHYPNLEILVLSMHDESLYAERVLRAGAKGYIMKQEGAEKVMVALRQILKGQVYVSDNMASKILQIFAGGRKNGSDSPMESLSDREFEVFQLIGQGRGTRQIAEDLHLSVKTVETHREHIKEKLKLKEAVSLLRFAVQWVESQKRC
jgi:DNA-binding NarL/FixJ family response regulator